MTKLKPSYRHVLKALAANGGVVPIERLPDGNGRNTGASVFKLREMMAAGLIEYVPISQVSARGYRITLAGLAALSASEKE